MKIPTKWRLLLMIVAGGLTGAALGALAMFAILYNKPGKNAVLKIERMLDRKAPDDPEKLAIGAESWQPIGAFKVEPAAAGFDFPTRIVFVEGKPDPGAVFYYIAELGGTIKAVLHGGEVRTVANGLLNYQRAPLDELGLIGLAHDPAEQALFTALTYWDADEGVYRNKVERLALSADGLSTSERQVLLDMPDEATVASYQIQFCALGPDGLLYVGVGSGARKTDAQDLDKFAGKILRLNRDGTAADGNPFYSVERPDAARSYVYAYGLRNPYDIAWDPRSATAIVSDVGPGIDRIVRLVPGMNYVFGNDDNQMRANALYTWGPGSGFAPTGVAFALNDALGAEQAYHMFVGLFGAVHLPGPNAGKRICRFELGPDGYLRTMGEDFLVYGGSRFASVTDVEWGPDGLYFADLYGESTMPHARGGVIYRVVPDPDARSPVDQAASLTGAARGRYLFFDTRCNSCHVLDGAGGREGPALDNARANLARRLLSKEYDAWLDDLSGREGKYFERHHKVYQSLRQQSGNDRLRTWLHHHIKDPRFDNPNAKMPSHELPDTDVDALATFLLSL